MNQKELYSHSVVKYRVYVFVWLGLVGLTWLTVTIAGLHAGRFSIFFPLIIATVKASMVLSYFMHLKYEKGVFKILVPVALTIFAILLWLVFTDVIYR